jgi:Predicted membrane protein involved in D-alanine export
MNFVTFQFAIFFLFVLILLSLRINTLKTHKTLLLGINIAFYSFAGVQFLPLLLIVAFINYYSAVLTNSHPLKKHAFRRGVIGIAVLLQILILGFFKYYEFLILSAEQLINSAGLQISLIFLLPDMDILLPVGLSFYIFQGMSYAIDRYRDTALKPMNFLDVLLFVSFFPVVLSGPIMRSSQFFPQLMEDSPAGSDEEYEQLEKKLINRDIAEGFSYILSGLFKKVVLASYLSEHIVRDVFQSPEFYSSETVLVAMYAYAMQIFCDFSGYTDIAIGIGRLIGFKTPQNFNAPYLATSLKEFWHRWHISLSAWLRDYVYFSLGGNRKGNKYINLFITMTLGGLWHGSHLRFLIWGMAHGLGLVFNHAWARYNPCKAMLKNGFFAKTYAFFSWFLTFHAVCVLWLFFRAGNTQTAFAMITKILAFTEEGDGYPLLVPIAVLLTMLMQVIGKHCFSGFAFILEKLCFPFKAALIALICAIILKLGPDGVLPFIYFQF